MKAENTKAQMRKGILDYCILLIINKQAAYTSDIIEQLKFSKLIVVEGTLYPLLTRLKNAGYLNYSWQESQQGPPRKYYELTDNGKKLLKDLEASWNDLTEVIEHLKTANK